MLVKTVLGSQITSLSSFVIHTTIPGSFVTRTRTPSPFTYTTRVDGVELTTVSTPPVETYVTSEESTVSALATVVVTPAPTLDPTLEGSSVTTIVGPQAPTTYTTDISGSLTTIITTPPSRTRLATVPISWSPKTITRSIGGSPSPSSNNETTVIVDGALYDLTPTEYFTGAFLPTFLAMLVGIPISLIDSYARLMQPFHALTKRGGAMASGSLDLTFNGPISTFVMPHRLLIQRQPVTYLTSLLTWSSWLLVPLAGEAIGLQVYGRCSRLNVEGCAVSLGISPFPKNALVVLIAIMAFLLMLLLFHLRNWNTGVHAYPWSIGGIAALTGDARLRQAVAGRLSEGSMSRTSESSGGVRFALGDSDDGHYGIVVPGNQVEELHQSSVESNTKILNSLTSSNRVRGWIKTAASKFEISKHSARTPFICLTYTWRGVFIAVHMGVLALVVYYRVAQNTRTADILGFKPGFGSRFLFSTLGKIISLFWSDFLISMATIHPFVLLSPPHLPQPAASSILIPRPTNEFSVMYWSLTQLLGLSHPSLARSTRKTNFKANFSLLLASFVTILSKFLPILMTNIPYTLQQTYPSYIICTTTSMVILSLMIATLLGLILLMGKLPYLPSDPRTISGMMYYLLDSSFYGPDSEVQPKPEHEPSAHKDSGAATAADGPHEVYPVSNSSVPRIFSGLGHLPKAERDRQIIDLDYRYAYGEELPDNTCPKTAGSQSPSDQDTVPAPTSSTNTTPRRMKIYVEQNHTST
ncbi:hypothetical protein V8F20_012483 [Naviculisporaceae sp. PSN 640]